MGRIVLDASALLAFLFRESGMDRVRVALSECVMSDVNRSEVIAAALERGGEIQETAAMLGHLPIEWVPFDSDDATLAASLSPKTEGIGLSLGDRCCLALGLKLGLPVLTADGTWTSLDIGVAIEAIR